MADISTNPQDGRGFDHGTILGGSSRLRRRRWAELRLKAYGIAAIGVAGFALVALLSSVVMQASKALTEHYITAEVTLDPEVLGIAPDATGNELLRADFDGLTTQMLREAFPEASGRTVRRALGNLVSGGAPFELADKITAEPELLGQTITYDFLASDVTDLYLKDEYGTLNAETVTGTLSVTEGEGGDLVLTSSADDFLGALMAVKEQLFVDVEDLRVKAARQANAVAVYGERASAAETAEEREKQLAKAEKARTQEQELLDEANALEARARGAGGSEAVDDENISLLVKAGGGWIRLTEVGAREAKGEALTAVTLPVDGSTDWGFYTTSQPESARKVSDHQIVWIETLKERGQIKETFNWRFFTAADSRAPELAGIRGALVGSLLTMAVTFGLAFPIGVLGAIYLEEFAPKNRFTAFLEVNINNLAAVPSIVFGLLGLAVFLNVFGVPRSAPLAGGIVLALMTLPTIIIAARAAIQAVPPSIREAALGVGASNVQASFHHVLPLAMPGILTGTIIGMAQALGETAPLIMIGMVAFIVDVPTSLTDSATVLPVQVYRWSDFPERAFEARTAAAICVLLLFLVLMNLLAIVLRRRFERRW
ncbi:phosphate ABC transporter permease PstA [Marinovum sp.]|uniref:phosphate ABC transporter permease PstA n=1 Tax=Marinovum sp. TaxID=2024839 RepID=UPI003A9278F3